MPTHVIIKINVCCAASCRVDAFKAWWMSAKHQFINSPTPPGVLVVGTMSTYNGTDPFIMHLFEKRIQLPLPGSAARAALFMRHLAKLASSTPPQPHTLTMQDAQVRPGLGCSQQQSDAITECSQCLAGSCQQSAFATCRTVVPNLAAWQPGRECVLDTASCSHGMSPATHNSWSAVTHQLPGAQCP